MANCEYRVGRLTECRFYKFKKTTPICRIKIFQNGFYSPICFLPNASKDNCPIAQFAEGNIKNNRTMILELDKAYAKTRSKK